MSQKIRKKYGATAPYFYDFEGSIKAAIRYAKSPVPRHRIEIAQMSLITVESVSKYSAIPPHTPKIFLSVSDL